MGEREATLIKKHKRVSIYTTTILYIVVDYPWHNSVAQLGEAVMLLGQVKRMQTFSQEQWGSSSIQTSVPQVLLHGAKETSEGNLAPNQIKH